MKVILSITKPSLKIIVTLKLRTTFFPAELHQFGDANFRYTAHVSGLYCSPTAISLHFDEKGIQFIKNVANNIVVNK